MPGWGLRRLSRANTDPVPVRSCRLDSLALPVQGNDSAVTSPWSGSKLRPCCWLLALMMVLLLIATIGAEPLSSIPNPRTRDGTWVTDVPRALRPETVARINATIGELERTNGVEMAVVVITSLDGLSVEEAAAKLFQLWGIGKKREGQRFAAALVNGRSTRASRGGIRTGRHPAGRQGRSHSRHLRHSQSSRLVTSIKASSTV